MSDATPTIALVSLLVTVAALGWAVMMEAAPPALRNPWARMFAAVFAVAATAALLGMFAVAIGQHNVQVRERWEERARVEHRRQLESERARHCLAPGEVTQ